MTFETISAKEFSNQMNNADVIVLDMRVPEEYNHFGVLPIIDLDMNNSGFEYVKDLTGGTDGWCEAGFELLKKET